MEFRSRHRWARAEERYIEQRRETLPYDRPVSIYEVHLGSWRLNPLEHNRSLSYLELADELSAYAHDLVFTHVEPLPAYVVPIGASAGGSSGRGRGGRRSSATPGS